MLQEMKLEDALKKFLQGKKVQEGQPEEAWQAVQGYQCADQNTDNHVQI